jgi:hypothetical protein
VFFAAETEPTGGAAPGDPLSLLLQYGVLGIFAILLIMYARSSIGRDREKADRAEQHVRELNDFIRSELLPKQVEATLLHKQVTEVLHQAIELLTEVRIRDEIESPPPRSRRVPER